MNNQITIDSPVGPLTLVASGTGLRKLEWGGTPTADGPSHPVLIRVVQQLREYFAGKRQSFDVVLEPEGTDFQLRVWGQLNKIRYGETISYGELAKRIGNPKASRAVGAANGRNPISIITPCHRVIGSTGRLTGFGGGLDTKSFLLELEQRSMASDSPRPEPVLGSR